MRNVFRGIEGGHHKTVTSDLIIERDLKSGLFGMGLGVGYPASIVAQMLARREIVRPGPARSLAHVPDGWQFNGRLAKRGIPVTETVRWDSWRNRFSGERPQSARRRASLKEPKRAGPITQVL